MKRQITEYLDIDLATEMWCCHSCGETLISARESYKKGCLVAERDPTEVHNPRVSDSPFTFAPDPEWCRLVEFYCPGCGGMIENEYLPPGPPHHPRHRAGHRRHEGQAPGQTGGRHGG